MHKTCGSRAYKTDQCLPKDVSLSQPFASTALQNGMTSDDEYVRMLPTFYHDNRHHPVRTTDDLPDFFCHEFDLKRLNDIHGYLWLAGRRMAARPFHRQNMMSRQIIPTELVDLCTFSVGRFKPIPKAICQLPSGPKGLRKPPMRVKRIIPRRLGFRY